MKNYDATDASVLIAALIEIYIERAQQYASELAEIGGNLEIMGRLWEVAELAAIAINKIVDFKGGWPGVFAYEELGEPAPELLPSLIFAGCVAGDTPPEAVVLSYAKAKEWPLL